jgi:NADH-quinone oxidoreductase subunit M
MVRDDRVGIRDAGVVGRIEHHDAAYLSLAIWVPIAAGVPCSLHRDDAAARWLALVGAVAGFAVTIPLFAYFTIQRRVQFVEAVEWIPRFNINYLLGIGIWCCCFAQQLHYGAGRLGGLGGDREKVAQYMAAFLIMSGLTNGVFTALDGVTCFRVDAHSAVPDHRHLGRTEPGLRGDQVLSLHTAGSLLMLSRSSPVLIERRQLLDPRVVPASAVDEYADPAVHRLFLAFAVKVNVARHTWLPDAHVEVRPVTGGPQPPSH